MGKSSVSIACTVVAAMLAVCATAAVGEWHKAQSLWDCFADPPGA